MKNLYLDDQRTTPENFEKVYSYEDSTRYISDNGIPNFISFDHDLGEVKTRYDCAKFFS